MKDYKREYPLFSLCGLNCGLCPMHLGEYCPGCGGGAGNQPCRIIKCSQQHGEMEYCHQCEEYPCEKYDGIDEFDSFITHRNQLKDFEKVGRIGLHAYQAELDEKIGILRYLLDHYNDGRRKNLFCIAVNLLELHDIKPIMAQLATEADEDRFTLKERAALAASLFQAAAAERDIVLKLNKKPGKK